MIYVLNLIVTVLYSYLIKSTKILNYIPILLIWIIILGGQYEVGKDYRNYLDFFYGIRDSKLFFIQKEYLFYYFLKIMSFLFSNGQIIFVVIGGLESLIFLYFLKKCRENKILLNKKIYIFLFLYLAYGTVFYNQMNGLRQYFNIYLFSLGIIYMLNRKKIKYCLINLIAIFIHRSSYLLLPFYLIYSYFIKKNNKKYFYFIILLVGLIISLIDIKNILEIIVLKYTPKFSGYFLTERIQEVSLEKKIVKYVYLPFYFCAINLIEKRKGKVKEMIKIGVIGYSIRIAVSNISIVNRIGEYFIILSIFPIYYLIEEWLKQRKNFLLLILIGMICGIFFLKVTIFAKGEYFYRFYLFN